MTSAGHSVAGVNECPVCGGVCLGFPEDPHPQNYPFLPGGFDPMAGKDYIIATERIVDTENHVVAYGSGERVPIEEAKRLGVKFADVDVLNDDEEQAPVPPKKARRARRKAEDRARKPSEDR